jgi:hypothetical protein
VISAGVIFIPAAGAEALAEAVGLTAVAGAAGVSEVSIEAGSAVFEVADFAVRMRALSAMENVGKTLLATPEGLLHLFLNAGVSVEYLACAFKVDAHAIESSLREAMRKRDAINRAAAPSTVEMLRTVDDAA